MHSVQKSAEHRSFSLDFLNLGLLNNFHLCIMSDNFQSHAVNEEFLRGHHCRPDSKSSLVNHSFCQVMKLAFSGF